jgi:hypothetical protein
MARTPDIPRPVPPTPNPRKPRRLILWNISMGSRVFPIDHAGITFRGEGDHDTINLTGIFNASATCPLSVCVQEQCELGDWHTINRVDLPLWGTD